MNSPLVSVVIPTYNRAHLIGRTIESVLGQSYDNVELVIVDDGSKDNTRDVIVGKYDARVRYFQKPNGGPASARNFGFREARGDYVALLDSDDTWHPWKLTLQIRCMEKFRDLGMTWTDMEMIDPDGKVVDPAYLRKMYSCYRWFTNSEIFAESHSLRELAPELTQVVGDAKLRIGNIYSNMVMGNLVHTSTVVLRRDRLQEGRGLQRDAEIFGRGFRLPPAHHARRSRRPPGPVGHSLPAGNAGSFDRQEIRHPHGG